MCSSWGWLQIGKVVTVDNANRCARRTLRIGRQASVLPHRGQCLYERAISQHLRIGIETLRNLRREGPQLHPANCAVSTSPPSVERFELADFGRFFRAVKTPGNGPQILCMAR
jgi:hypothetical protein